MKTHTFFIPLIVLLFFSHSAVFSGNPLILEKKKQYNNRDLLSAELLNFTARCAEKSIVLDWVTNSETNNELFTLERSPDGASRIVIAAIDGAGNSSVPLNYSYTDVQPETGISYYRLRYTDTDGNFNYSGIIDMYNCAYAAEEGIFTIYPNPSNGTFNVLYNGNKEQILSIEVFNERKERVYYSGSYQTSMDLSDRPIGVYYVYINIGTMLVTKKIAVEKR